MNICCSTFEIQLHSTVCQWHCLHGKWEHNVMECELWIINLWCYALGADCYFSEKRSKSQSFRQALFFLSLLFLCLHFSQCKCVCVCVCNAIVRNAYTYFEIIFSLNKSDAFNFSALNSVHYYHSKADAGARCFHWTSEWFVMVFNNN